MEWGSISSIVMGALVGIGLSVALRRRKKTGLQKRQEFYQHLKESGVEGSLLEKGSDQEKIGLSRFSGQRSEGLIKLKAGNIDLINIISVTSQYGTSYFLDYLVKSPNITGNRVLKKTRSVRKKNQLFGGKVTAIEWRGDESLAQSLNFDYNLKDRLLQSDAKNFGGNIWIFPEPEHGYIRIRTIYSLPSPEIFKAIDIIAKHLKSW
ncbi:MAG: hypothetical protein JW732_04420 [Dehalococcoidia bacterium]|nr:hypothetical protein [Dehalococcoidia bacterium]